MTKMTALSIEEFDRHLSDEQFILITELEADKKLMYIGTHKLKMTIAAICGALVGIAVETIWIFVIIMAEK